MSVCLDQDIICVPNHSRTGGSLCLSGDLKCNGEDDCLGGADEDNCPAFLPGGIKALIAIVVIAVVMLIPVIYVIIRKKQRKSIIPDALRPIWERMTPCCSQSKEGDRSSQHLTQGHQRDISHSSDDKDGFTNVGFDTNSSSPSNVIQQHAVTGQPLNKFKRTVQQSELERQPSYRDWQANRLQPSKQFARPNDARSDSTPRQGNGLGNSSQASQNNRIRVEVNGDPQAFAGSRIQPNAVVHKGPITYAPSTYRPDNSMSEQSRAYAIASPDGRSNYEARSHLRRPQEPAGDRARQTPWQQNAPSHSSRYHFDQGNEPTLPPNYDNYAQVSSAVPPNQLREALEKVAVSSSRDAVNYQRSRAYDNSADTVV